MPSYSATLNKMYDLMKLRGAYFNTKDRYVLHETFQKRVATATEFDPSDGTLATLTQAELRSILLANPDWEVTGTNASLTVSTLSTTGGASITTAANTSDTTIIAPKVVNSVQQSAWGSTPWSLARMPIFRAQVSQTFSGSVFQAHWGLKKTANVDTTTDNDQIAFEWDSGVSTTTVRAYCSVGGTDYVSGTDFTQLFNFLPTTGTVYETRIEVDLSRYPRWFINDALFAVGPQLTSSSTAGTWASLAPVFGVGSLSNTASTMSVKSCTMSRLHAAPIVLT